jgi:DnaJ-class molecular chaperone
MAIIEETDCPMCNGEGKRADGVVCEECGGTGKLPAYDSPEDDPQSGRA